MVAALVYDVVGMIIAKVFFFRDAMGKTKVYKIQRSSQTALTCMNQAHGSTTLRFYIYIWKSDDWHR